MGGGGGRGSKSAKCDRPLLASSFQFPCLPHTKLLLYTPHPIPHILNWHSLFEFIAELQHVQLFTKHVHREAAFSFWVNRSTLQPSSWFQSIGALDIYACLPFFAFKEKLLKLEWKFFVLNSPAHFVRFRLKLRPRMLRNVAEQDISVTVLGQKLSMPICASPTAFQALAHPEGELATVRGKIEVATLICGTCRLWV